MHAMAEISGEDDIAQPDLSLAADMERMAMVLDAKINDNTFDTVEAETARKLFAAMIKVYSLRTEAGERDLPLSIGDSTTNATDLMITASALLKAGNLEVFEMGMWQSYTRFV